MGRHSARSYRPAHSAHGSLYWHFVMWPSALQRAMARSQPGRRRAGASRETNGSSATVPAGAADTAASGITGTWRAGEGNVKPTW